MDGNIYYGITMYLSGLNVARFNLTSFDNSNNSTVTSSNEAFVSRTSYRLFNGYSYRDSINLYGGVSFSATNYGNRFSVDDVGPYLGVSMLGNFR